VYLLVHLEWNAEVISKETYHGGTSHILLILSYMFFGFDHGHSGWCMLVVRLLVYGWWNYVNLPKNMPSHHFSWRPKSLALPQMNGLCIQVSICKPGRWFLFLVLSMEWRQWTYCMAMINVFFHYLLGTSDSWRFCDLGRGGDSVLIRCSEILGSSEDNKLGWTSVAVEGLY